MMASGFETMHTSYPVEFSILHPEFCEMNTFDFDSLLKSYDDAPLDLHISQIFESAELALFTDLTNPMATDKTLSMTLAEPAVAVAPGTKTLATRIQSPEVETSVYNADTSLFAVVPPLNEDSVPAAKALQDNADFEGIKDMAILGTNQNLEVDPVTTIETRGCCIEPSAKAADRDTLADPRSSPMSSEVTNTSVPRAASLFSKEVTEVDGDTYMQSKVCEVPAFDTIYYTDGGLEQSHCVETPASKVVSKSRGAGQDRRHRYYIFVL